MCENDLQYLSNKRLINADNLANINENGLIVINCEVNNARVDGLIDSGASSNYISLKTLTSINNAENPLKVEKNRHSIQLADKSQVISEGKVKFWMNVDERSFLIEAIVLKDLNFDLILSMRFIRKYGVLIDTDEGSIYFNSKTTFPNQIVTSLEKERRYKSVSIK